MSGSRDIKVHKQALDKFMQATSCARVFLDKYEKDPDNLNSNDLLILFYALECLKQQLRDGCKSTMIRSEAEALCDRLETIVNLLQVIDWDSIKHRTDTKTSWEYAARVFGKSFENAKKSRNSVKRKLFWKRLAKSLVIGGIAIVSMLPTANVIAIGIGAACFGGGAYTIFRIDDKAHLHRIGFIYPYCIYNDELFTNMMQYVYGVCTGIYNNHSIWGYLMPGCPREKQIKEDMEYIKCTGVVELNSENYKEVLTVYARMLYEISDGVE